MKKHLHVLSLATRNKLPESIDNESTPSAEVVRELIEVGYLKAIDASQHDGAAYLDPKITLPGREHLAELRESQKGKRKKEKRPSNDGSLDLATAISGGSDAWLQIEKEYDVSKRTLGKRISFVHDEFKRRVIFRDMEQAFLLAHRGFSKPAVILAGGVIEELLRLYLESKKVAPAGDTLDSYIRACEANHLIKGAIQRLADAVRQFRNIVHMKAEISSRHSISKATAKGAVSSVFTIVNDFTA